MSGIERNSKRPTPVRGLAWRLALGAVLTGALLTAAAPRASAEPVAVDVENRSYATKCAEEDNVYYTLRGSNVRAFTVTTEAPPYLPRMVRDITAPDFTDCSFGPGPIQPGKPYTPPTATLYEDEQVIVKGIVYPDFWRPTTVPVKVGNLTQNFLHLVQVWKKTAGGVPIEFLVVYPQDGYWRLRPLPPARLHEIVYGSSFLVGPVEESTRPFVAFKSLEFDVEKMAFRVEFARGGKAEVRIAEIDVGRSAVRVTLDPPADSSLPFAALRSMYVSPEHADTAEALWQATPGGAASRASVIDFKSGKAAAITFGRTVPSTHNTSAPDVGFRDFDGGAK